MNLTKSTIKPSSTPCINLKCRNGYVTSKHGKRLCPACWGTGYYIPVRKDKVRGGKEQ